MKVIEILMDEHRVIEGVLACLSKMAAQAEEKKAIDVPAAEQALDFIRNFADRCHHGKEEAQLFPLIEEKQPTWGACGPSATLRAEHEHGRTLVRSMGEALEDARKGSEAAVPRFVRSAGSYVDLLRAHIAKEDGCFFPRVSPMLDGDDRKRLLASFERVEKEEMGEGTHERLLGIAASLAARFGITPTKAAGGCSCGHGGSR